MKKRCLRFLALILVLLLAIPADVFAAGFASAASVRSAEAEAKAAETMRIRSDPSDAEAAGTVHVESDPAGADLYLDGELYRPAVTPCELPLSDGSHTLSIRMHGYDSCETTVRPGDSVSAHLRATIPEGPGVRTILVNADDHGNADGRYITWEFYERFVLRGEPEPEWEENWTEEDEYALCAYYAFTDGVSLREAICVAMNDNGWYDEENRVRRHYVIEFADTKLGYEEGGADSSVYWMGSDVTCYGRGSANYVNGEPLFMKYSDEGLVPDPAKELWSQDGCFTINGDRNRDGVPDVTLAGWEDWSWDGDRELKLMCSDVHVVGLRFEPSMHVCVGIPFHQPKNYFNLREIYITGCEFKSIDNGVGRFFGTSGGGMYGQGAEGPGMPGAFDIDGFCFSGCTFRDTQLGIIVCGADCDYVSLKNLVIQGNHFINGNLFVRNADAHSWYMWGQYSEFGSDGGEGTTIGVSDYSTLEDVMISGNLLEFNADALGRTSYDGSYGNVLHLGNSNLGNSHHTMRNVTVRCNRSTLEQANIDAFDHYPNAGIGISNVSVGESGFGYDPADVAKLCETSHNLFDGLLVEYNDFAVNYFDLTGLSVGGNGQTGVDNHFRNIRIEHNRIASVKGLHLQVSGGTSDLETAAAGTLENLSVTDNEIRVLRKTGWGPDSSINSSGEQDDFGIRFVGADVANFETNWDSSGEKQVWDKLQVSASGVNFARNTVTGFANGILVAASICGRTHYVTGITVDQVTIADNKVVTDGVNKNCSDRGILLVGAIDGGTNCVLHDVTVTGNRVTAANGLMAVGFYAMGMRCRFGIRDNRVLHASASGNRFTYADPSGNGGFPIVTADAVSGWDEIPYALGRSTVVLTESGNSASGFPWKSMKLSELSLRTAAGDTAFLAAVQSCSDKAAGANYIVWSRDKAAAACEIPLYTGVCDTPNYRPGGCHRFYLSPCEVFEIQQTELSPTCTEPGGVMEVRSCSFCQKELGREATAVFPALGHAWDSGIVLRPAAELETGTMLYTCTRCGETRTQTIPKIGDPVNPFVDVKKGKYFYEPVLWAFYHEPQITAGTNKNHFSPTKICTRGQVVTFLWRANGCPAPNMSDNPFVDVPAGKFYHDAVLWAYQTGVTTGTNATHFNPDGACTRGHVVTFLWKAAGSPPPKLGFNPFTDVKNGKFYYSAVLWAVENGVTNGTSADTFSPNSSCTRGQVVTFLYNVMVKTGTG